MSGYQFGNDAQTTTTTVTLVGDSAVNVQSTSAFPPLVSKLIYSDTVFSNSPRGYWRLGDLSGVTVDASNHSHDGTLTGGVTRGVTGALFGDSDTAMTFDGSSGYIDLATPATLASLFQNKNFSVEFWALMGGSASNWAFSCGVFNNANVDTFLHVGFSGNHAKLGFYGGDDLTGTVAIPNGQWCHVVATWNHTTKLQSIYVNGQLDSTRTSTGNLSVPNGSIAQIARAYFATGNGPYYLGGSLDEVAVYNYELASTDVLDNYTAGINAQADRYVIRLDDGANFEYCLVGAATPGTFTATRAQESTTAKQFGIGTSVSLVLTKAVVAQVARLDQTNPELVSQGIYIQSNPIPQLVMGFRATGIAGMANPADGMAFVGGWSTDTMPNYVDWSQAPAFWGMNNYYNPQAINGGQNYGLLTEQNPPESGSGAMYLPVVDRLGTPPNYRGTHYRSFIVRYKLRSTDAVTSIERLQFGFGTFANGVDTSLLYDWQETYSGGTTTTASEGIATSTMRVGFVAGGGLAANVYATGYVRFSLPGDADQQPSSELQAEGKASATEGTNVSGSVYTGSWAGRWRSLTIPDYIVFSGVTAFDAGSWARLYGTGRA